MQIKNFKAGDIIQRISPPVFDGDAKFIGRRMKFLGCANNIIFVRFLNPKEIRNQINVIAGGKWLDDGWDLYPEELYQKLRKENKETLEKIRKANEENEAEEKDEKDEEDEEEAEE